MTQTLTLPLSEGQDYYEIRLESIGGLGANLCGKMLGELGSLYLDFNSSAFSSYGSEKRGSPVKSYVRFCSREKELRINSPVTSPDLLVIFHEALIERYPVFSGSSMRTNIVINTKLSAQEAAAKYRIPAGNVFCIDALSKSISTHSRVNMILFGALIKASGFLPLSESEALCKETIGKKYPTQLASNITGLRTGYNDLSSGFSLSNILDMEDMKHPDSDSTAETVSTQLFGLTDQDTVTKEQVQWDAFHAPIGGINTQPGSTVTNNLSPSREGYIPLFIPDRCINCGLCDSTCPDFVFQFKKGTYRGKEWMINSGLDYYHCKGCLRCVEICPTNALIKAEEQNYERKPWFVPNKDLLSSQITYDQDGSDPYITSESYLTEKRVDGGLI